MFNHTHQTACTEFVQANGISFAYRRFGKRDNLPLVFKQHFTGTMDHWEQRSGTHTFQNLGQVFERSGHDCCLLRVPKHSRTPRAAPGKSSGLP
jgi:hypothetical protein